MQVYLMSSSGYYVNGVSENGFCFTNQKKMAHLFNDMPLSMFSQIKEHVERSLQCELEINFG